MLTYNTIQPYPQPVLSLLTTEGFQDAFWQLYRSKEWKSRKACFEELNQAHSRLFGYYKYSEYASFANQLSRVHKKRRNQTLSIASRL